MERFWLASQNSTLSPQKLLELYQTLPLVRGWGLGFETTPTDRQQPWLVCTLSMGRNWTKIDTIWKSFGWMDELHMDENVLKRMVVRAVTIETAGLGTFDSLLVLLATLYYFVLWQNARLNLISRLATFLASSQVACSLPFQFMHPWTELPYKATNLFISSPWTLLHACCQHPH